ncbi:MAG: metallophosphatase family protein [Acidobacteriia bacterium]|nr:metallophosphatase family protein [Terriglobia bacterium]
MRVLLLSDIHSNLEGLEACLEVAPSCDKVVNLGDIVGYGASPNEVTDRSRKLGGLFVRGNHDKACTGVMGVESFNPIAGLAALWTKQALSPENLEFLKNLPRGPIPLDGIAAVQLVHGSPIEEDEYIIVLRDAIEPLMRTTVPLTFFGHTHIQCIFSVKENQLEMMRPMYRSKDARDTYEVKLERGMKYLVNPGSVGQPRDGDRRAGFAVFDTESFSFTFHRVPYNIEGAQQRILAAKLPDRLATRLADGR